MLVNSAWRGSPWTRGIIFVFIAWTVSNLVLAVHNVIWHVPNSASISPIIYGVLFALMAVLMMTADYPHRRLWVPVAVGGAVFAFTGSTSPWIVFLLTVLTLRLWLQSWYQITAPLVQTEPLSAEARAEEFTLRVSRS